MNKESFLSQVQRLSSCFGSHFYSKERIEIIWSEIKHISDQDLKEICDDFIADSRFAPLRKEFREALSTRRLNKYLLEKEKRSQEYHQSGVSAEIVSKTIGEILRNCFGPKKSMTT